MPRLTLGGHAPLVIKEVGIAPVCAIEGFRVFDGAQERFGEIQRVNALVQEWVAAILVVDRQRSSAVRRIFAAAEVVESKRVSNGARTDHIERFGYETVVQHGMVDANGSLRGSRGGRNAVDLLRIHRERFFDQYVGTVLESCDRQSCVGGGGSEDMNYVDSLIQHAFHRGEDFRDAKPFGQSCRAEGLSNVGDSTRFARSVRAGSLGR